MAAIAPSKAEEKARKVRTLLASYYNADNGSPLGSPSKPRSGTPSPLPPSPSRDPKAATRRILQTAHLSELVEQSSSLAAEVSSLDSDMQMLVYENYNKFMIATDTIRAMAGSLDGVDEKLNQLQTRLDAVSKRGDEVSGRLDLRQRHIEELGATRMLLRRLQAVFELPKKIRMAIDSGSIEVAVDLYDDVAPLLKNHGHKDALRKVRGQIEELGSELLRLLTARLEMVPAAATECIQQMARLGRPKEDLQAVFLERKRAQMDAALRAAKAVLDVQAASSSNNNDEARNEPPEVVTSWYGSTLDHDPALHDFLVELDSRFLNTVAVTCAEYRSVFSVDADEALLTALRASFHEYVAVARRAMSDCAAVLAARDAGITLSGALVRAATNKATLFRPESWSPKQNVDGLYVLRSDIGRLDSVVKELRPLDRVLELAEYAVRQHLGLCFAAFERRVQAELAVARAQLSAAEDSSARCAMLGPLAVRLRTLLGSGLSQLVTSLAKYAEPNSEWVLRGWRDVFSDALAGRLRHCVASLAREMLALAEVGCSPEIHPSPERSSRSRSPSPQAWRLVSTVESSIAAFASTESTMSYDGEPAPEVLSLLFAWLCAALASGKDLQVASRALGETRGGGGPTLSPRLSADLLRELGRAQSRLGKSYAEAHAARLELAARSMTQAEEWSAAREPRAPREVCLVVLESLEGIVAELAALGDPVDDDEVVTSNNVEAVFGRVLGANMNNMLERERLAVRQGYPSALDVCSTAAARALRAAAATLRATSLPRTGFQQVQLDVHFLRNALPLLIQGGAEESAVLQGLDDVLAAAMERCSEPVLLEPAVLDRILTGAFEAQRGRARGWA